VVATLPTGTDLFERSADPGAAQRAVEALTAAAPERAERMVSDEPALEAFVVVAGASPWLARVAVNDPLAIDVLSRLQNEVDVPRGSDPVQRLRRLKELEILRIAARDLTGADDLVAVGASLAALAARLLHASLQTTAVDHGIELADIGLCVIGMGKLGASELNYASDIDVLLVGGADHEGEGHLVRELLRRIRATWKVDLDLRPEGRSGPLTRTLDSYEAYWDRWADTWEFQALLKARAVAGDQRLGERFEAAAGERVWGRPFGADELASLRQMKARAEKQMSTRGLDAREIKRGRGGIRDVEFALQLLQLVHGRLDPSLRVGSTIDAIGALTAGGYITADDGHALDEAYRYLRAVEHRLQLREGEPTHTLPTAAEARTRLARLVGYRDLPGIPAVRQFEADLGRHRGTARRIHERLFFRPLLEAFTFDRGGAMGDPALAAGPMLNEAAIVERLSAFGFTDARRTRQAIRELTSGFSRMSRLMQQMLPVLLDWLSEAADPDEGLLGLRTLADEPHARDRLAAVCRDSPIGAQQLCRMLGTGRRPARELQRHPDALTELATGQLLRWRSREELDREATGITAWRGDASAVGAGLRGFAELQQLRIAARDVLGEASVDDTGRSLADLAEAVVAEALRFVDPPVPIAVVGMGRLGGRALSFGSDLDLLVAYDPPPGWEADEAAEQAEAAVAALRGVISGGTPAAGAYRLDFGLRPEGRHGPMARSIGAYAAYYDRWAQVWERQALLRGRVIAGDPAVAAQFSRVARRFVWERPFTPVEALAVRRMKARVEKERVPAGEDPKFHLKLGPGALSDVEWTVQLLQLQHRVEGENTVSALSELRRAGAVTTADVEVLEESYRFCERARNRLYLTRDVDVAGDSLPGLGPHLSVLARSLGMSASDLRGEYTRVTRRARRVVERLFYGRDG
jgi:glutamate-ammonia-ligase adenylyltransferase